MARVPWLNRTYFVLGRPLPAPVALLIGLTFLSSILAAQAPDILTGGLLAAGPVLRGEVWRLFTYVLFEMTPWGLIFYAIALFLVGGELVRVWGPAGFLAVYFGIAGASGIVTVLLAFAFTSVASGVYGGPWPVVGAITIAFAVYYPARDILMYLVLPLRGRNLIYFTIGFTLLTALLFRFSLLVPHFAAELGTLAWLRGLPSAGWWAKFKDEIAYRRWKRRASKLKAVPNPPRDEPPRYYH